MDLNKCDLTALLHLCEDKDTMSLLCVRWLPPCRALKSFNAQLAIVYINNNKIVLYC